MAVGKWLHDNPHTHYTSTNAATYFTIFFLCYVLGTATVFSS